MYKILIVSTQVFTVPPESYGGLELVVYNLSYCLAKEHNIYVLAPEGSKVNGCNLITPCKASLYNPEQEAYESIKPSLRDFDIIIDHSWGKYTYLYKKDNPSIKILGVVHSSNPYLTPPPVPKPCFLGVSKWHSNWIRETLKIDARYVYNGIDLDLYPLVTVKEDFLLYVNRIASFKGAHTFATLCREMRMKGIIVGEDQFVEDRIYCLAIMQLCDGRQIQYYGRVPHDLKVELMQKARALVCPLQGGYYEVFGLSTIEAMACGTPVASTDMGAPRELIIEGVTGSIATDLDSLKKSVEVALQCKPEDCRQQAELFSRENMTKQYLEYINNIISGEEW